MTRMTRLITVLVVLLPAATATAQFVPDGLRPGDVYHLMFLTDGVRDAWADSIADFNGFVQSQAEQNPPVTGTDTGVQYRAVVSAAGTQSMTAWISWPHCSQART